MSGWTALDWRRALVAMDEAGEPHVLVSVLTARGSTPRAAGAKMVVAADGQAGTIGGGALESRAIDTARRMLAEGATESRTWDADLGGDLGQCCGGAVRLLYEPMPGIDLRLALFGAGHVARALVRVLEGTAVRVLWIDERAEAFPAALPPRMAIRVAAHPPAEAAALSPGTHVRVMTHSHARDYEILDALLARDDLGSIGVIGSKSKWAGFRARLAAAGVPEARIAAVLCPVGLPGLPGKRPAEIAISVAAELLRLGAADR